MCSSGSNIDLGRAHQRQQAEAEGVPGRSKTEIQSSEEGGEESRETGRRSRCGESDAVVVAFVCCHIRGKTKLAGKKNSTSVAGSSPFLTVHFCAGSASDVRLFSVRVISPLYSGGSLPAQCFVPQSLLSIQNRIYTDVRRTGDRFPTTVKRSWGRPSPYVKRGLAERRYTPARQSAISTNQHSHRSKTERGSLSD